MVESQPDEPQEAGVAVKDPENMTLYVMGWTSDEETEPFYFPLARPGTSWITASWLREQMEAQLYQDLPLNEVTVEGRTATVSMLDNSEVQFMRTYENGERYLSSVAMTLLQNCEVDTVRFTVEGEPFPSAEEEEGYLRQDSRCLPVNP